MKLDDPLPSAKAFQTLLCGISNNRRLQKLIGSCLSNLARNVDVEVIHSIGSCCTNLHNCYPKKIWALTSPRLTPSSSLFMLFYMSQTTVAQLSLMKLIQCHIILQQHASLISSWYIWCYEIAGNYLVSYCSLVTKEMASCIVQLH